MGRKMSWAGIAEEIVVEGRAIAQALRRHDEREVWLLSWNRRALDVYGPLIEAHGTPTQREIYRRHLRTAAELVEVNEFEDRVHEGMAAVSGVAVAS